MKRGKRKNRFRLRRLDWMLLGVMAVAIVMLAITLADYAADRDAYTRAQALAVVIPSPTPTPDTTPEPAATPTQKPLETPPIAVDFAAIQAEGRHVRGWLFSEGTIINYPVTYYTNNTYYLTHDYKGDTSKAGALMFDARMGKEIAGDNVIIYGHHMKDRSMFGSLLQYQKQEYYDAHPTMYLVTESGNYRIDVFASRFADSNGENYPIWFADETAKRAYAVTAVNNSDFTPADKEFRPDARIVTLVTCAYSSYIEDAKYQVLGWLMPIG